MRCNADRLNRNGLFFHPVSDTLRLVAPYVQPPRPGADNHGVVSTCIRNSRSAMPDAASSANKIPLQRILTPSPDWRCSASGRLRVINRLYDPSARGAATARGETGANRIWCGREDLNFHGFYPTAPSTLRVYQFRHDRICP